MDAGMEWLISQNVWLLWNISPAVRVVVRSAGFAEGCYIESKLLHFWIDSVCGEVHARVR